MPRRKFDITPSSVAAFITTIVLLIYYVRGLNSLPQTVLLPIAGQVLSVGVHSLATISFSLLTRWATYRPLPLDVITPFLINIDTQLNGIFTAERMILVPVVNLVMLHTPETLLGTLAAGKHDIRSTHRRKEKVELGPFGGAFDRDTYYLSGQVLLSRTNPDTAYRQVAYKSSLGWTIPRKPIIWYEKFAERLQRDNDAEKRIFVPDNEAAVLEPVPALPVACKPKNISDFGFTLFLYHCDSYIGFNVSSRRGRLPNTQGFYRLHRATVSARYQSRHGERFVKGNTPRNMVPVPFPRVDSLWDSMASCFLNAISFNRPPSQISLTDRLVLSAVVRTAGFDHYSGFSTPPLMADAEVSDVVNTNVSRWVIATMWLAVVIDAVRVVLSKFNLELLSPELEPLVTSFRDVQGLSGVGRYLRKKRGWRHRIWGLFERNDEGGGRWIIPEGMNGNPPDESAGKVDAGDESTDDGADDSSSSVHYSLPVVIVADEKSKQVALNP